MILLKTPRPGIIELDLSGVVSADDFIQIRGQVEGILEASGKTKFLFDLTDVTLFTLCAAWQDTLMEVRNFTNIGTTAVVANQKLYADVVRFVGTVSPEKVENFRGNAEALSWLSQN